MVETSKSGSMSGERKRDAGPWPTDHRASLRLYLRPPFAVEAQHAVADLRLCRSPTLGERMMLAHELLQPLVEHVGIDLGGRDVGVTEQLLH